MRVGPPAFLAAFCLLFAGVSFAQQAAPRLGVRVTVVRSAQPASLARVSPTDRAAETVAPGSIVNDGAPQPVVDTTTEAAPARDADTSAPRADADASTQWQTGVPAADDAPAPPPYRLVTINF